MVEIITDIEAFTDPLTGLGTRSKLIADLGEAVDPSSPKTLAIFDLGGFTRYVDLYGRLEGEALLIRLARRLAETLAQHATCYRPRYNEFAVIVEASAASAELLLSDAVAALTTRFEQFNVTIEYGAATMPGDAAEPIEALALADTRLFLHAQGRRSRERREFPRDTPRA